MGNLNPSSEIANFLVGFIQLGSRISEEKLRSRSCLYIVEHGPTAFGRNILCPQRECGVVLLSSTLEDGEL